MSGFRRAVRRRRSSQRFARPILVAFVALSVVALSVVLFDHYGAANGSRADEGWTNPLGYSAIRSPPPTTGTSPTAAATARSIPPATVISMNVAFPHSGPRTFSYAQTTGDILGTAGPIRRFRVAIESNIKAIGLADLVAEVNATLGDPRSWIAGRDYRLQMVPETTSAQFTVYLATATTTNQLCWPLPTNSYTSCRQGAHVVLNLDRWMKSAPDYIKSEIPLNTYRTYMVNHEVGHALGHIHERCPAAGRPAPVMQQQTLGLRGCTANPWPFVDGEAYDGPFGHY
jgi:hypothetical protein